MRIECEYLVIGSGVAGLTFALEAAKHGRVVVVTKRSRTDSATNWAQGGHRRRPSTRPTRSRRTSRTPSGPGGGLSHDDVVEMVVRDGPDRIRELIALGAEFSPAEDGAGGLDLTREGGHSARRVVHAGGHHRARGAARLGRRRRAGSDDRDHRAPHGGGPRRAEQARGPEAGRGGRTSSTSGPARSTPTWRGRRCWRPAALARSTSTRRTRTWRPATGVAMAYRAGAELANMEFFQFHPHLPLPPRRQELPDQRGPARRGRHPPAHRRHRVHGAAPRDERPSRRVTSWRGPSTSR